MGNQAKKITQSLPAILLINNSNANFILWTVEKKETRPSISYQTVGSLVHAFDGKQGWHSFCVVTVSGEGVIKYLRIDLIENPKDEGKVLIRFDLVSDKPKIPYFAGGFEVKEDLNFKDLENIASEYLKEKGTDLEVSVNDSGKFSRFLMDKLKKV